MTVSRILGLVAALSLLALVAIQTVVTLGAFWIANLEAIYGTFGITLGYGVLGMLCARTAERGHMPRLMASGVVAGGLAALGWVATMYFAIATGAFPFRAIWILVPLSGWQVEAAMIAMVLQRRPASRDLQGMRQVTIGLGALFMAHVVIATCIWLHWGAIDEFDARWADAGEATWRSGLVLGLLWAFAYVATSVWSMAPTLHRKDTPRSERLHFRVTCPRCGCEQQLLTEGDRCARCRLLVKVDPA